MPRSLKRLTVAIALAALLALIAAAGAAIARRDDPPPSLAGAELLAGNGDRSLPVRNPKLEGLRLDDEGVRASHVRADPHGNLFVVTSSPACFDRSLRPLHCGGNIIRYDENLRVHQWTSHLEPAGQIAIHPDGSAVYLGGSGRLLAKLDAWSPIRKLEGVPVGEYSGSYTPSGTLVLSDSHQPWLVAQATDGTVTNVLTPPGGEPAPLHLDSPNARLTVVALPDGRIAFATNAPDDPGHDGQLYIIDGLDAPTMTLLDTTTDNPIRRIFPGPDGTLLALDGPHISQVDPDTGTTTSLIDLSELTDELAPADVGWPQTTDEISATVLGDDLVFTADTKIWRLPDAFA